MAYTPNKPLESLTIRDGSRVIEHFTAGPGDTTSPMGLSWIRNTTASPIDVAVISHGGEVTSVVMALPLNYRIDVCGTMATIFEPGLTDGQMQAAVKAISQGLPG